MADNNEGIAAALAAAMANANNNNPNEPPTLMAAAAAAAPPRDRHQQVGATRIDPHLLINPLQVVDRLRNRVAQARIVVDHDDEEGLAREEEEDEHVVVVEKSSTAEEEGEDGTSTLHKATPDRMELTDEERTWAREIKAAVEACPELDNLSDMMYAQFAICTLKENIDMNLEALLERLQVFQSIKEEYGVQDTAADGIQLLKMAIESLLPNFYLSFSGNATDGTTYVMVLDVTQFDMAIFNDVQKLNTFLAGVYYLNHAMCCDFTACRQGMTYMIEAMGYDWRADTMFTLKAFRSWADLASVYPHIFLSIKKYHTGIFTNLLTSVGKRFLPQRVAKTFEVGCVCPHGRLNKLFQVPTVEASERRLIARLTAALHRRYQNEANFKL